MYKHNNKKRLEQSRRPILWLKRKLILIISAFMIGMANGINDDDKMMNGNQNHTEQQDKKD